MLSVVSITLPIFLLIGLGYVSTARGVTTKDNICGIGVFVLRFALPALIFRALSTRSIADILNLHFLAIYAVGSLAAFAAMFVYCRLAGKSTVQISAMSALGVSCSNAGFVGFPAAALVVCGPAVLAIVFGAAASAASLHLPEPLFRAIDLLASASTAAALFGVGGALAGVKPKGLGTEVGKIVAVKLCLHPLLIFAGLYFFPGLAPPLAKSMLIFASAPMLSAYPLIARSYGFERQAAASLLGATVVAFFTMSAVLALL